LILFFQKKKRGLRRRLKVLILALNKSGTQPALSSDIAKARQNSFRVLARLGYIKIDSRRMRTQLGHAQKIGCVIDLLI
jgi:septum formation topological specificity factor MinE